MSVSEGKEGLEMRVRYAYDASRHPPPQSEIRTAAAITLQQALERLQAGRLQKAGTQREDMKQQLATMSFVEKGRDA